MIQKVTARYEEQNLEAARIVLSDVEAYGGEPAALVIWARAVIRHHRQCTGPNATGLLFANQDNAA